jgi:hypothetical protein
MKGEINADHMPLNKFELRVAGLVPLTTITISGLEDELETVDLPDRTRASAGVRKSTEFEIEIPMHHHGEFAAMEIWYKEGQDPISPTYKKPCTLRYLSASGNQNRSFTLVGVFVTKRTLPDLDKTNEGEMSTVTYSMSVDDILPI